MNDHEYAGFWIRISALLVDLIVIAIVCWVPLMLIYGNEYWVSEKAVKGFWDVIFNYIIPFAATIWFWLKFMGTPGKMAFNLKIVDAKTGEKMSVGQSIGRYFAYIPSMLPLCLGCIWVGIDNRKQGWHDKLAGTVVIRDLQKEQVKFEKHV